jgi:hypothetical protein
MRTIAYPGKYLHGVRRSIFMLPMNGDTSAGKPF